MAGFAHYWDGTSFFHFVDDELGEFGVEDYLGVGLAGDEVLNEEEEDVVGGVKFALGVDNSDAITVAVESDSKVGIVFFYFFN